MPMPTKSPAAIAFAIVAFTWLSGRMAAGAKSIPGVPPSNPLATKSSANARPTTAAEVAQSRKRPSRGSARRTVQRRDEVRAAREDACLPCAADLAVDDVHVLGTSERVERPLRAHLDAGLAVPARGARRGPHVTRRLAVRLAGAAVREQERHDDVFAAPGGAREDALDLAEDAVAIAAEECRDVV